MCREGFPQQEQTGRDPHLPIINWAVLPHGQEEQETWQKELVPNSQFGELANYKRKSMTGDSDARAGQQGTELATKARQWVSSEAGKEVVQKVLNESTRTQNQLTEARRINPEQLKKPVSL